MIGTAERANIHLSFISGISEVGSPDCADDVGNVLMFNSRGDLDAHERRTLATVLAWAFDRETAPLLRDDFAMAVDDLSSSAAVPAGVLALVAAHTDAEVDPEIMTSLRQKLTTELDESPDDLESLINSDGFTLLAAPYWLYIVSGLARLIPTIPTASKSLQRLLRRTGAPPDIQLRHDALRERRVARRTLHHLIEHRMVDTDSGSVMATVLAWSLVVRPNASDSPETVDLLEQLRSQRLVPGEVDEWMRSHPVFSKS